MRYSAFYTESVEKDIEEAARYIRDQLHNPSASENLLAELSSEIRELEENPFICAVIDDPILKSVGLRFSVVRNFLLFYTVSTAEKTITILRFLNGRMNWKSILRQSFSLD